MKNIINFIALWSIGVMFTVSVFGQELDKIKVRIVNKYNQPIEGALVISNDGEYRYVTSKDGKLDEMNSSKIEYVIISAEGYQNVQLKMEELLNKDQIVLSFDPHRQGGVIDFGYQKFTRESITGAVSSVSGDELSKTPSNNLTDAYIGRLSGLTAVNFISELTYYGYGNYIKLTRGISSNNGNSPLVVVDGVIAPTQYLEFISPKEIENISVLKDASATVAYGIQGAHGVLIITTKRGATGKLNVEGYFDNSFQQTTIKPLFINSAKYAELRNEAGERDGLGPFSQFTKEQIDLFRSETDPKYPNNNWYNQFVKDFVTRQRTGVNVSGGSEKFRYYSNLSLVNQNQPFKIANEPERKYDPTSGVNLANFRTNMDVKFNNFLSGYMRLTGHLKREKLAGATMSWNIYDKILRQPSSMYGPLTPIFEDDENISNRVVTIDGLEQPAYGILNRSGYGITIETNVIAQTGLRLNMDFLTEGLSAGAGMAYQTYVRNETFTTQNYSKAIRGNDLSKLDNFISFNADQNTPLRYSKGSVFFYYMSLMARMDYNRRFGNHSIDATFHSYYLKQETEDVGNTNTILPYKRQNFGLSALYGFKSKYYLKTDMGHSGSEQFHPDYRYSWSPAISGSWVVSQEDFFKNDIVSLLKIRGSYGINTSDQLGGARFLYLDNIRSDGTELDRGNPKLQAERIHKTNLGIDLGFFNAITINADYFFNQVNNMLINSSAKLPEYQGIPLQYYPKLNEGEMENKGYEIALGYNKKLNENFSFFVQGSLMQAKNKIININESPLAEDYAYRYRTQGYSFGQSWGYKVDYSNGNGMFNSQSDLDNSSLVYSFGTPRVGDLKYSDLNNDGVIDAKDMAPIGHSLIPEREYNVVGQVIYKNWDFSFLIHGVSRVSQFISGLGVYENINSGVFNDIHLNSWTPERYASGNSITFPALSLSPSVNHVNSDFFWSDRSYLRLRNVELAFILPKNISGKIKSERIRIAFNAQNLFTIHHMKSRYIDPEIGNLNTFQPYRVFNLGVSANF